MDILEGQSQQVADTQCCVDAETPDVCVQGVPLGVLGQLAADRFGIALAKREKRANPYRKDGLSGLTLVVEHSRDNPMRGLPQRRFTHETPDTRPDVAAENDRSGTDPHLVEARPAWGSR
nr:hypothetical protein [Tanacetum cinerariifolium]